ncbi:hypothetical protein ACQZ32_00595 [Ralstonia pseudosolanacearum]|uniref:Hypothetical transmembrane protein n=1 Tax=Ralstonia nicotianae (strain ATCC BAA-1114 / GMI1000) TaxID=267608 RepID=Q8XPI0_RALN1|nr:hypothetical protein [Ralstonia pseudosolanacearum]MDC6285955.1 hypothetical protein [Ralstonia pseudosolanacearum]MDC6291738.1 hypothetical protein [Ralstonia pseudosolanacearum]MDD7791411.1 hypothetical protein [Ralstonia pseudosolanacearum]MDN3368922.1 hypothetical protein [Ralstonia pseudosolanacearum]CAD18811.1 hypothetical transmembrane protein [Ralstonia pseudosolanacearum GMI1000]
MGIVRLLVWLVHIASLGVFFLPVTPQLLGFAVVAFDAPGHGDSDGKQTDMIALPG